MNNELVKICEVCYKHPDMPNNSIIGNFYIRKSDEEKASSFKDIIKREKRFGGLGAFNKIDDSQVSSLIEIAKKGDIELFCDLDLEIKNNDYLNKIEKIFLYDIGSNHNEVYVDTSNSINAKQIINDFISKNSKEYVFKKVDRVYKMEERKMYNELINQLNEKGIKFFTREDVPDKILDSVLKLTNEEQQTSQDNNRV
jgi:hypothetical protein